MVMWSVWGTNTYEEREVTSDWNQASATGKKAADPQLSNVKQNSRIHQCERTVEKRRKDRHALWCSRGLFY